MRHQRTRQSLNSAFKCNIVPRQAHLRLSLSHDVCSISTRRGSPPICSLRSWFMWMLDRITSQNFARSTMVSSTAHSTSNVFWSLANCFYYKLWDPISCRQSDECDSAHWKLPPLVSNIFCASMQPFLLGIPDHHLQINSDLSIGIASFDNRLLLISNFSPLRGFGTEAEYLCLQILFHVVSIGS